jgi:hypothetical protein
MSDSNRRPCLQAKLKELIERASSAADANLHRRRKPYPLGFAVRANGSKFAFRPESIEDEDNDTAVAHKNLVSAKQRRVLRVDIGRRVKGTALSSVYRRRSIRPDGRPPRNHNAAGPSLRTT